MVLVHKKLESQIKSIARENGAALVGIGSCERFAGAPPSADPAYVLPAARSVVSLAIPLDRKLIRDFLSKQSWLSHGADRKNIYQKLYRIADFLTDFLAKSGYQAKGVDANNIYRPEPGGTDAINRVRMVPDFSHRYAAVAAGLAQLGWSGNAVTPQYGAAVYFASVLTSAELEPDPLLEENPCDKCKLCITACPVEMVHPTRSDTVRIAGREYTHGKKGNNARCLIGCGGYHGLNPGKKWSTWAPYRVDYPLPEDEAELIALSRKVRAADPDKQGKRSLLNQRDKCFDPGEVYIDTCGNCQLICWERREDREENRRLLINSGVVALTPEGKRIALPAEQTTEVETNRIVRVAVPKKDASTVSSWLNNALANDNYNAAR